MFQKQGTIVVAVGGNSLISDSEHTSVEDQAIAARESMKHIAALVKAGWDVVVTHGNGPQVGFLLRRTELAVGELPPISLDVLGADTQGATGYLFTRALQAEFAKIEVQRAAVALVTQTIVDAEDPAFKAPTKPIGSFMSADEAKMRAEKDGWTVVEDSGRGWRRVVASPQPKQIVELPAIKLLVDAGYLVVAGGGGGIPVVEEADGLDGVEAVIDKDHATALLANDLKADVLLIATAVEGVAINFNTPEQRWLGTISVAEARQHLNDGQFGAGSMAPKMEAAINFVERGGGRVVITSPPLMVDAVAGRAGTTIVP